MALPGVSFKEFVKNPIAAFMFICMMAVGYLYFDNKSTLTDQVERLEEDVEQLQDDNKELNAKLLEMALKIQN